MTHTPESHDTAVRVDARHRAPRQVHRPAAVLTSVIAVGAVALAGFAAVAPAPTLSVDEAQTGVSTALTGVTSEALASLSRAAVIQQNHDATVRIERVQLAREAVAGSAAASDASSSQVRASSEAIAERREAARLEAERLEAERLEAERLERERLEAERLERERLEAERLEAERREAEQAAARAQERAAAPAPAPPAAAPAPPAATPAPPTGSSRSIARNMLGSYGWGDDQWSCLDRLWERESNWNHLAQNPSSGAYGIPQSLPASKMASAGADYLTNPATQISWGLGYIQGRYGSPCSAWAHSQSVGWY